MQKNFIIDFDSTFTQVEALDLLSEIVFENHDAKSEVLEEVKQVTELAMDGKLDFRTSLERRVDLLKPTRRDITQLIDTGFR